MPSDSHRTFFDPGQVVSTPGVIEKVDGVHALTCLARHITGDWGIALPEDAEQNVEALASGARLMSVYPIDPDPTSVGGKTFWIITEAVGDNGQRASTTFLLPEEY